MQPARHVLGMCAVAAGFDDVEGELCFKRAGVRC